MTLWSYGRNSSGVSFEFTIRRTRLLRRSQHTKKLVRLPCYEDANNSNFIEPSMYRHRVIE